MHGVLRLSFVAASFTRVLYKITNCNVNYKYSKFALLGRHYFFQISRNFVFLEFNVPGNVTFLEIFLFLEI